MKAYLAITGTIFGLLGVMHILRAIDERQGFSTNPGEYIAMAALGFVAAGLSVWAWRLFLRTNRP
jgi:hypothetical protein